MNNKIYDIDINKLKEAASKYNSLKKISEETGINISILRYSLYYSYQIKNKNLKKQYQKIANTIIDGRAIFYKNKL